MNIAFIPVRCGSKSIPFKNIREFCGRPLVYWTLKALQDSSHIDRIVVATDCDQIKNVVQDLRVPKVEVYDRRPDNAQDTSSTESVMIEFIEAQDLDDDDIFVLVQATSPLTQTKDIDKAFNLYQSEGADSLLTCVRNKRFFWSEDGKPLNYDYKARPRRQDFEGMLMENGAFYISTVGNIRREGNRLSGKITVCEMNDFTAVELDEEDDWVVAEKLMKRHILNLPHE